MSDPPSTMFRAWVHSFEEDGGGVTVYRPPEHEFPRARGRAAIEIRPDGTFIDRPVGPADARQEVRGRWQLESPGRLRVSFEGGTRPSRVLQILQSDEGVLKLRQGAE